jgi:hypothetical protein
MPFPRQTALAALGALALLGAAACDDEAKTHKCQIGREQGSGYPSACVPMDGCDDGSVCGAISPTHDIGVCAKLCTSDDDCAVDLECSGVGRCILDDESSGDMLCAYTCEVEDDCPINMNCGGYLELNLCYPVL